MLYEAPPFYTINGVSVMRDHADPLQFYYMPLAPRFVTRKDGAIDVPQLLVVKYRSATRVGGFANFDVGFWMGILAPAGTPRPIIDRIALEVARLLAMPDMKEKITSLGGDPYVTTPDEFAARMKSDSVRYAEVIKQRNIKID